MRRGERVFGGNAEIANSTALGHQHDRLIAAPGKRDVAGRMAVARASDVRGGNEEIGQHEFAAHVGRIERTVWTEAY